MKLGESKILLANEKRLLESLRIKCGLSEKVKQLEEEWGKIEKDVKEVIANNIDTGKWYLTNSVIHLLEEVLKYCLIVLNTPT